MELLDVLKRIPPEHYTEYKGRYITVKELIGRLSREQVKKSKLGREREYRVKGNTG